MPFQTVEDGEVNIQYKKAVLSLKVTPHVIDSKTLKLAVKVNKDEVDFSRQVLGNPTIITKNAETNVIQFDGQTLVIGGLNKEQTSDDRTGTPGLLDVPILGWLFKAKTRSKRRVSLMLFLTPSIVREPEDLEATTVQKNLQRLKFLKANNVPENDGLRRYGLEKVLTVLAFGYDLNLEQNARAIEKAIIGVKAIEITRAVRDARLNGR